MADNSSDTSRRGDGHYFGKPYAFADVFNKEIDVINERRARQASARDEVMLDIEVQEVAGEAVDIAEAEAHQGVIAPDEEGREQRGQFELEVEGEDVDGKPVYAPPADANLIGLSLSGGGIRSAAFCLGVLQALDAAKVLEQVDYMSTVSGGGYIGCSLTGCLEEERAVWNFPYASLLKEDEPRPLQHIRDFSNYLFPRGAIDLLHNASIYARGLIVNAAIVAPFLLFGAALTLWVFSYHREITGTRFESILNPFGLPHFFATLDLALLLVAVGIIWGIIQSTGWRRTEIEIPGVWTRWVGVLVIIFAAVLFCEAQPFVIDAIAEKNSADFFAAVPNWVNAISAALAPITVAVAFLNNKVGEYIKSLFEAPTGTAQIKAYLFKGAIVLAGLVLPLLVWILYLDFTYWGLCINGIKICRAPEWLKDLSETIFASAGRLAWLAVIPNFIYDIVGKPTWLGTFVEAFAYPATVAYLAGALIFFLITLLFLQPNANSLHPLYRDRLGKAFLFRKWRVRPPAGADLVEERRPRLSEITGLYGPYHLINSALNVEASKVANRRGRNADFFIFSPKFVGSKSTGYAATSDVEQVAVGLNLATAMAASGAAVSSNMGAQSIKPLTATLALLNIRLGFWLRNPNKIAKAKPRPLPSWVRIDRIFANWIFDFFRIRNLLANYYFLAEMFGRLSDQYKSVYLTDGGHIENLGIYELLRRRCKVIIAVDAEADPRMAFGSFNTLERYALIDLGIRVDLPWQSIADQSLVTSQEIDSAGALTSGGDGASNEKASQVPKDHGPHCAIGEITYPNNRKGALIYIKASLTGDENDYIFDYKRRYSAFPHETTLDQMFTEEQFECYRALGFHAAFRLFDRDDDFAHLHSGDNLNALREIQLLDRLFPRPTPKDEDPPHQKTTFAEWAASNRAATKATSTSHSSPPNRRSP
jgi:hypothetical protein